jgi:feruloyl esterase
MMNRASLDACDGKDGVVDGLIEDPTRCDFDPQSIQCHGPDAASCLTAAQVKTARSIYAGAKFKDGSQLYRGFEPGSELGWALMAAGPEPINISTEYFKGIVFENPDWDFRAFDVDRDTRYSETRIGDALNGVDPNLKPFKDRGGKLILYQAWNETIIPPRTLMDYYRQIEGAMGGADQTRDFARLFMVPGARVCPGFSNAEDFDTLKAVEQWVEKGVAPHKIIYAHRDAGKVYRTRPVCAYPNVAIYRGSGDPDDEASFICGKPDW